MKNTVGSWWLSLCFSCSMFC